MGTLNFTVLHTLLHVLIKILNQSTAAVEFQGNDSERIKSLVAASKPATPFNLTEYKVVGDQLKPKRSKEKLSLTDVKESGTKSVKSKETGKEKTPEKAKRKSAESTGEGACYSMYSSVVVVEPTTDGEGKGLPHLNIAATQQQLQELQSEIEVLKEKYFELAELPGNLGLIEATKEGTPAILNMFQSLKLSKRIDANEEGLEKMVSLLEDLAKSQTHHEGVDASTETKESFAARARELRTSISAERRASTAVPKSLEKRVDDLEKALLEIKTRPTSRPPDFKDRSVTSGKGSKTPKKANTTKPEASQKTSQVRIAVDDDDEGKKDVGNEKDSQSIGSAGGLDLKGLSTAQALGVIQNELNTLSGLVGNLDVVALGRDVDEMKKLIQGDSSDVPPEIKISQLEQKYIDTIEQINNLDTLYGAQIAAVEREVKYVREHFENGGQRIPGGPNLGMSEQHNIELQSHVVQLTDDLNKLVETTTKLIDAKDGHTQQLEAINEQIDVLKIIKANREDLDEALGDKADACAINRKVSHDQFDAACEDLARGIDEAMAQLSKQEAIWHQAMDDIQREIGNKIDRLEVDPLKDFVNNKLKNLHEKFRTLTALKKEQEAAGTKSKLLRNVNCISCDKDVVMKKEMDASLKPQARALPPSRNIAPYLAYELDQLRKQQKCIPNSKNLNYFESAVKSSKGKDSDHICNRYCGGSHTVTTPQQRVTRLGHFLDQWGPEISPVHDEYMRGNDNHMYKSRDNDALRKAFEADAANKKRGSKTKLGRDENGDKKSEADKKGDKGITINERAKELITDLSKDRPATRRSPQLSGSVDLDAKQEFEGAEEQRQQKNQLRNEPLHDEIVVAVKEEPSQEDPRTQEDWIQAEYVAQQPDRKKLSASEEKVQALQARPRDEEKEEERPTGRGRIAFRDETEDIRE